MRLFRYSEDQIPVAIICALFLLDVGAYFFLSNPVWLALWMLVGLLPKGHICAWNHHHQHVSTFRHALPNRLLEVVYALMTGISSNTWFLHHSVGHHVNYLDQQLDESRWQDEKGETMGVLRYTLEVGATAYWRAWQTGAKYPKQRAQFVWMGIVTALLCAGLIAFKPVAALILFIFPMVFGLFFTAWATYSHHSGRSTESHMVATNNILHGGYNMLTGNLGLHTAHHLKPGVHWSRLPQLHAEISSQIPADCYLTPGFPWTLWQRPASEVEVKPLNEDSTSGENQIVILPAMAASEAD
jgi:fatty acid desaturase